jgi:hypothetical protein
VSDDKQNSVSRDDARTAILLGLLLVAVAIVVVFVYEFI